MCISADPDGGKGRKGIKTGDQGDLTKLALDQEKDKQAQDENDSADSDAGAALRDGGAGSGDGSSDGSKDGSGVKTDGGEGDENLLGDGDDENNMGDGDDKKKKRSRTGPLVPDTVAGGSLQCIVVVLIPGLLRCLTTAYIFSFALRACYQ